MTTTLPVAAALVEYAEGKWQCSPLIRKALGAGGFAPEFEEQRIDRGDGHKVFAFHNGQSYFAYRSQKLRQDNYKEVFRFEHKDDGWLLANTPIDYVILHLRGGLLGYQRVVIFRAKALYSLCISAAPKVYDIGELATPSNDVVECTDMFGNVHTFAGAPYVVQFKPIPLEMLLSASCVDVYDVDVVPPFCL